MGLKEIQFQTMDWIHVVYDRVQSEHFYGTLISVEGGEFLDRMSDFASEEGSCSMELVTTNLGLSNSVLHIVNYSFYFVKKKATLACSETQN
jgi:hypothetical protein